MRDYLILKLQGPMQVWGEHTFEGLRPSANFPTRSGLLGLLGACLGIRRDDREQLKKLADGMGIAVRIDSRRLTRKDGTSKALQIVKTTDYHTVKDAREDYTGLKRHETIQTWREYLYDAEYTVALWIRPDSNFSLDELEGALNSPTSLLIWAGEVAHSRVRSFKPAFQSSDLISALQRVIRKMGLFTVRKK